MAGDSHKIIQTPTDLPVLSVSVKRTSQVLNTQTPLGVNAETGRVKTTNTVIEAEGGNYPEGGKEAWLVVFGSFISMVASFGVMNTLGTLHAHLSENKLAGHSEGEIGWIFGLYTFVSYFGGIQIGPIFDAYGPRWLMIGGSVCLLVGLILFSIAQVYWQFMVSFGILVGLGTCLILTPAVASVGHWFFIRRAYATGVATTGGSIGGIIFPLLIQAITPKVGFEWSIRVVAFICLLLLLTGNCLVRARLEAIQPAFTKGEQSQGSVSSAESSVITIVNAVVEPAEKKKSPFDAVKIDINAFRDPRFLLTTVGVFLIEWALFVPLTYITSYSLHYGLPFNFSYQLLAILNAGSVFGRWLPGFIADRIGRFNTLLITVMLCLTTVLGFWLPTSYIPITENSMSIRKAMLVLFSFFYGFGSGSGISLTPVCVGQICSTHQYGSRHGTCYFFASFAALTGIPIAGQLVATTNGNYIGLIYFTATSYIGAFVFIGAARYVGGKGLRGVY